MSKERKALDSLAMIPMGEIGGEYDYDREQYMPSQDIFVCDIAKEDLEALLSLIEKHEKLREYLIEEMTKATDVRCNALQDVLNFLDKDKVD